MAKQRLSDVNEDFMKDIISQGIPIGGDSFIRQNIEPVLGKEEVPIRVELKPQGSKKRKEQELSYIEEYLKKVDFEDRQMITITRQTHTTLNQIINIIGGKQATLGGYIENIVRKHFELHKDEINRLCQEQPIKPIL